MGKTKEECLVDYIRNNHPALYGQLVERDAVAASGLGSVLALGALGTGTIDTARSGRATRLGRVSVALGGLDMLTTSLGNATNVTSGIDYCLAAKCVENTRKIRKSWYEWPFFSCEKCPDGTIEYNSENPWRNRVP
jgi:hypothetical protein